MNVDICIYGAEATGRIVGLRTIGDISHPGIILKEQVSAHFVSSIS